jgi:hypothetical protein
VDVGVDLSDCEDRAVAVGAFGNEVEAKIFAVGLVGDAERT